MYFPKFLPAHSFTAVTQETKTPWDLREVGPHPSQYLELWFLPSSPCLRSWTGRRQGSKIEHWPYRMRAEKLVPANSRQNSVLSPAGSQLGVDPQGEAAVSKQGPASPAGRECFQTDWQGFCWADPKQNWEASSVAFPLHPPLQGTGLKFTLLSTDRLCFHRSPKWGISDFLSYNAGHQCDPRG